MKILNRSGELAFAADICLAKDVATTLPAKMRQTPVCRYVDRFHAYALPAPPQLGFDVDTRGQVINLTLLKAIHPQKHMAAYVRLKLVIMLIGAVLFLPRPALAFGDWDHVVQVRSLQKDWHAAQKAYLSELHEAKTPQERDLLKAKNPDLAFASKFLEMAQKWRTNSEAAAEALVYSVYGDPDGPVGDKALGLLARDHVNSQTLEMLFQSLQRPGDEAAIKFFRTIAERSTKRTYQGQALKLLADLLQDSKPDEAEKLYNQVIEKYADVPSIELFGEKLGPLARRSLLVCIGKVVPDFSVEDIEGRTFKPSDNRGKVMLIYFCSEHCAPCRALYPYWRSLAERTSKKPFALVGIIFDSKQKALEATRRENVTWRIIWDGDTNRTSINVEWNVSGWPNLFLIDHKGIIRHHWVGSPGTNIIDNTVNGLLKEAEAEPVVPPLDTL